MATYNLARFSSFSPEMLDLTCDICGSENIIETEQGFVCKSCGFVLKLQKLQYDRPYNDDIIQYAKGLGRTQIGTKSERKTFSHYNQLERLNKYNSMVDYDENVLKRAQAYISSFFASLNLEDYNDIKEMVYTKFKDVKPKLRVNSKYQNTEKLIAILTYFCLKIQNISISCSQIIENSTLTRKEFNDFYSQVLWYIPEYKTRNRQKYILQKVSESILALSINPMFYHQSRKILYKLWDQIRNTTDNIIAGLLISICVLCSENYKNKVKVSTICDHLAIRMSTIQAQVKKKIIEKYKASGFVSLVKSAGILQRIFESLGLICNESEISKRNQENGKIEIVFGNATKIFNYHDNIDYYFFALGGGEDSCTIFYARVHYPLMDFEDPKVSTGQTQGFLQFDIVRYYKGKDPPEIKE